MKKLHSTFLTACSLLILSCATLKNQNSEPSTALERLQAGNARFYSHHMKHPDQGPKRVETTALKQQPFAVVVTCSDSRVAPEILFDEGIGDLFVIRNAGNIVEEEDVLASIEYAVVHLGVRTILIMGHEECGAIQAMVAGPDHAGHHEPAHIEAILDKLKKEEEEKAVLDSPARGQERVHQCVVANVMHGIHAVEDTLKSEDMVPKEGLSILGAVYDIHSGKVVFLPAGRSTF
ncbi:MAG TPA: carbonic anhydrase [Saprospiraceae bacterium]|nr:carbonic anhydrase [Saprospiraceae bacterium]HNT18812.1 carbonic anhydrase [Saprospiraceae bacterium]